MKSLDIDAIRAVLLRHGVALAILFGSRARKDARPTSDLDLAISTDGVDELTLAGELSSVTGTPVDLVDAWTTNDVLLGELVREGIILLEARPGLAAAWRTRALLLRESDRPFIERMNRAFLERVAARGVL